MSDGRDAAQRKILNRLKRARGQLDAVISAVESGAECKDVVTQLSATTNALNRAGFAIVSVAMKKCIADDAQTLADGPDSLTSENKAADTADASKGRDQALTMEQLEKLFMMLA